MVCFAAEYFASISLQNQKKFMYACSNKIFTANSVITAFKDHYKIILYSKREFVILQRYKTLFKVMFSWYSSQLKFPKNSLFLITNFLITVP